MLIFFKASSIFLILLPWTFQHQRDIAWAYLGPCTHGLIPSSSRKTLLWYNFTGCLEWVPDGQGWKTDNRNWRKGRDFNVLFDSLLLRDIRCEGPGPVPSFDASKESQNRKRVKKCFEEQETICISNARPAKCWGELAGATLVASHYYYFSVMEIKRIKFC